MIRIAVDAMGTDSYPAPDVAGAVAAARQINCAVVLVGDQARIHQELHHHDLTGLRVEVVHADQVIAMDEKPAAVGKSKPGSSIHVGLDLVRRGQADAFVTAGNTGAVHAVAMLYTLRRMPGVRRPALSAIFPIFGKRLTFLDVGANADCRPEWLAQFALMGEAYASTALNIQSPSVGLLANGEEDGKGSELVVSAGQIIRKLPIRFVGNVEPRQVLEGKVDVVVTDGFTGNILVKTFEASTRYLARVIRDELRSGVFTSVGGLLARPAFERARARVNTAEIGGAPLLGVNGVVVIAHGSSDSAALTNAIRQAVYAVETNALQAIQTRLALIAPPAPADESEKDG